MIVLRGGKVYDPAVNLAGEIRDIWIDQGKIIDKPTHENGVRVINVDGMILAPAGIEIHSHIAGTQINAARELLAGQRNLLDALLPTPVQAGERYLRLGYTTIFDAAMPPLFARQTQADLNCMGGVDRGTYTLMGDHVLLRQAVAHNDPQELRDVISWLLHVSGGYAVKLVNPGGGYAWKRRISTPGLDDAIMPNGPTQREFLIRVALAANDMKLPHPVHIHAGQLGRPGNWHSFCETVDSLSGLHAHFCHIQFYAYGEDDKGGFTSAAEQVVERISQNPQLSFDVGQVLFGPAMAITADVSAIGYLRRSLNTPWFSRLMEGEGGGSILPLSYLAKDPTSSVQWATGLELLLRFPDSSRMFLTTDHPNGGLFTSYPQILAWLMSKELRDRDLAMVNPSAKEKSGLATINREYTLMDVFKMTSWGPAKALGLYDRGHMGVGARADIRCYQPQDNFEVMFSNPKWVMREGEFVVEDGHIINQQPGQTLTVQPDWDEGRRSQIYKTMHSETSIDPETYSCGDKSHLQLKGGTMQINGVTIEDTFAEAFPMWASRLIITADTPRLALQAAQAGAGLGTSIIGCGCETGVGAKLKISQTPDNRPGFELLIFSFSPEKLEEALFQRVGQAILPSATSACFNGLTAEKNVHIGGRLRYFGDGFQSSKFLDGRRYWRIPVADGEFLVDESFGMGECVGGGNLILIGTQRNLVLAGAEAAVKAIKKIPGTVTPFPGGVCRSPSKIGAKYKNVRASTNDAYCPTLRTRTNTRLPEEAEAVYELVIDGLTQECVAQAMGVGMIAASREGMIRITAGNYGGKLGPYHFHLQNIITEMRACA